MGLLRIAAPSGLLVSLEEVNARLKIDITDDNAGVTRLIKASTGMAEKFTQRAFLTQQWKLQLSSFPCKSLIQIPLPPLQSVESIEYIDSDGVEQTLADTDYIVDISGIIGSVSLAPNKSWPVTQSRPDAVVINFTCGYGDAAAIPDDIVLAVLMLIGHFDINREATSDRPVSELPLGAQQLLAPFVLPGV